jgi:hypothetical protein
VDIARFADAFAIVALAVLFIAGVCLLGVAARTWMKALVETEQHRSLRMRVDAQATTLKDAEEAVDELRGHAARRGEEPPTVPSEEELLAWARAQSHPEYGGEEPPYVGEPSVPNEEYRTTDDNAMMRGASSNGEAGEIDPDHLFAPGANL